MWTMNYRHEFHAGNFADVMKHSLLVILLDALNRKSNPWCYFDTHAGAGRYDLQGKSALNTKEADGGISRLWPQRNAAPASVQQLCEIVAGINPELASDQPPRFYPGSPYIAAALARDQDRLILAELQPQEQRLLREHLHGDARSAVHSRDGYEMLTALVPPSQRRGLVLMDPPFEKPDEFDAQLKALCTAHLRWSTGVYALWYPMKDEAVVRRFHRQVSQSGIRNILVAELRLTPAAAQLFSACGMLVVNPPWLSEAAMRDALHYLAAVLAPGSGESSVRWLVPKQG